MAAPTGDDPLDVTLIVRGLPAPQGSKRPFRNKHTGKLHLVESSAKVKPWRQDVKAEAIRVMGDRAPTAKAIYAEMTFYFIRPKSHYRTGRNAHLLKESAPEHPAGRPDLSKLIRSTEDAMTGVVWVDDSQIVKELAMKKYCSDNTPGAFIRIRELTTGGAA